MSLGCNSDLGESPRDVLNVQMGCERVIKEKKRPQKKVIFKLTQCSTVTLLSSTAEQRMGFKDQ